MYQRKISNNTLNIVSILEKLFKVRLLLKIEIGYLVEFRSAKML